MQTYSRQKLDDWYEYIFWIVLFELIGSFNFGLVRLFFYVIQRFMFFIFDGLVRMHIHDQLGFIKYKCKSDVIENMLHFQSIIISIKRHKYQRYLQHLTEFRTVLVEIFINCFQYVPYCYEVVILSKNWFHLGQIKRLSFRKERLWIVFIAHSFEHSSDKHNFGLICCLPYFYGCRPWFIDSSIIINECSRYKILFINYFHKKIIMQRDSIDEQPNLIIE